MALLSFFLAAVITNVTPAATASAAPAARLMSPKPVIGNVSSVIVVESCKGAVGVVTGSEFSPVMVVGTIVEVGFIVGRVVVEDGCSVVVLLVSLWSVVVVVVVSSLVVVVVGWLVVVGTVEVVDDVVDVVVVVDECSPFTHMWDMS